MSYDLRNKPLVIPGPAPDEEDSREKREERNRQAILTARKERMLIKKEKEPSVRISLNHNPNPDSKENEASLRGKVVES